MNYYQDISLLPHADIGLYFLWQKIYKQIHLALVESKVADNFSSIGVSFPEYDADKYCLGREVRLFAESGQRLEQLRCDQWLNRLNDYVQLSQIYPVPENIEGYACFKHIRLKGNKERMARRRAKRKGETMQQSLAYFDGFDEQRSKLPYIIIQSETNGHFFHLFIEKKVVMQPITGLYSCYGLSNTSTVPLF